MNERLIDCEEFEMLLPFYLEGEADVAERRTVEQHAAACARCSALLGDLNTIVRAAPQLPTLTPSRDLWPEIESRIQPDVVPISAEEGDTSTTGVTALDYCSPRGRGRGARRIHRGSHVRGNHARRRRAQHGRGWPRDHEQRTRQPGHTFAHRSERYRAQRELAEQ